MTTLFDLTLRLARKAGTVRTGTATGGAATYLTDSNLSGLGEWAGGTLWILSGTYAGNSRAILTNPKDKVTFDALDGAIVAGVRYAIVDKHAPLDILQGAVSAALEHFRAELTDETLVQDSEVDTYSIPAAVLAANGYGGITSVELATQEEEPYGWSLPHRYWEEGDGEIVFAYECRPGYDACPMRLRYSYIPELTEDDDEIPRDVDYDALFWRSLIELLDTLTDLRPDEKRYENMMNQAQVEWQRAAVNVKHPRRADPLARY